MTKLQSCMMAPIIHIIQLWLPGTKLSGVYIIRETKNMGLLLSGILFTGMLNRFKERMR
ncbi:hypothetical protein SDC9_193440 [bioreactor metagenome]|uniref:Uncharacterized protein n=1 Tax=bioreactor metagenome TaxID=1076179 RepID=A0A645I3J5_9ZZZZ